MNRSFMSFLGAAVMCLTIGVVTKVTDNPRLSTTFYVLGATSTAFSILLLINPHFFKTIHRFGVAWMISTVLFGILGYYLQGIENCGDAALTCAGICALSAISAIGHGIYPSSQRSSSLVTLILDPVLFIAITWIALSGGNAPVEMFQADVADQMANIPQQEFGVIDTMISITVNLFKGNPVKVNGVMPFPHFFLLLHMIWNFFKIMRSYSYWFVCSSVAIPFLIVAWVKHVPRTPGPEMYVVGSLSAIAVTICAVSLYKHWSNPATS